MKYARNWKWENTWLTYSLLAILIVPWALAGTFVPDLGRLYSQAPGWTVPCALVFGALWGISMVTFGLSIDAVGMAVAVAVVSGLACLSGSLIPLLVLHPTDLFRPRGILLLVSIPVLLLGLTLYARAGRRREAEQPGAKLKPGSDKRRQSFKVGLAICVFTGIFASNFNLGLAFSNPLLRKAYELGVKPTTATYAVWALVLGAGFVPNLLYCLYLLRRNRTWSLFRQPGWFREGLLCVTMAALWCTGLFGYGVGTVLIGTYGTSLGFVLFMAGSILTSTLLGIKAGEWNAVLPRTRRLLTLAMTAMVAAVIVLNLGGFFS